MGRHGSASGGGRVLRHAPARPLRSAAGTHHRHGLGGRGHDGAEGGGAGLRQRLPPPRGAAQGDGHAGSSLRRPPRAGPGCRVDALGLREGRHGLRRAQGAGGPLRGVAGHPVGALRRGRVQLRGHALPHRRIGGHAPPRIAGRPAHHGRGRRTPHAGHRRGACRHHRRERTYPLGRRGCCGRRRLRRPAGGPEAGVDSTRCGRPVRRDRAERVGVSGQQSPTTPAAWPRASPPCSAPSPTFHAGWATR